MPEYFVDYCSDGQWGVWRITDDGPSGPMGLSADPMNRGDLFEMIRWAERQCGPGGYVDMSDCATVLFNLEMEGMKV